MYTSLRFKYLTDAQRRAAHLRLAAFRVAISDSSDSGFSSSEDNYSSDGSLSSIDFAEPIQDAPTEATPLLPTTSKATPSFCTALKNLICPCFNKSTPTDQELTARF